LKIKLKIAVTDKINNDYVELKSKGYLMEDDKIRLELLLCILFY